MTGHRILAFIAEDANEHVVTGVAREVGRLLHAGVDTRVADGRLLARDAAASRKLVVSACREPGVAGLVVDGRIDTVGAMELAAAVDCPVVFAPAGTHLPFRLRRLLVPLDGTAECAAAVERLVRLARARSAEVVPLHCAYETTVPRFHDRPHYDTADWTREFMARHAEPLQYAALELRVGEPGAHAAQVGASIGADLIVVAWRRRTGHSAARAVRALVGRSAVPVMLVPMRAA